MSTVLDPLGPAQVGWEETRAVLERTAAAAADLIRSIRDPSRPGVGKWTVGELAVHLTHPWLTLPALAARDLPGVRAAMPKLPHVEYGLPSGALLRSPEELGPLTLDLVAHDAERDLGRLADRIDAAAKAFCGEFDPTVDPGPRPWMVEGITAGPELFAAHLLNETFVHGYDLAKATGLPWKAEDQAGALVFRGFLLPILVKSTMAAAAVGRVPGRPFILDLRLAGDKNLIVVNTDRGLAVREPGSRAPDATMWIRPAALTLLAWRRRPLRSALLSGQMAVWGPKPWTARRLLAMAPKV